MPARTWLFLAVMTACDIVAWGQSSSMSLVAHSEYPETSRAAAYDLFETEDESFESVPLLRTANNNALMYEPQNEPLSGDMPAPIDALVPPLTAPTGPPASVEPTGDLPWVIPVSPQLTLTWNSGSGEDVGMTDLDGRFTLYFPYVQGLLITPGYSTHAINGPISTDLPARLYDNWIEFRWLKKWNERWSSDIAVSPSLYTDYDNLSSDAFRVTGRAIALYTASPEWQWAFGAIYLDRDDIKAMPAVGAIWTPTDDWKVEVLFPRPRIMRKMYCDDSLTKWAYLGGEFGGNTYAIERPGLVRDVVTYSALRMYVGYEIKRTKGFSPRVELGWTFNRSLEYQSGVGDMDLPSTAMLRIGGGF
ncbi:MAG TPA: DUF6268 family outer membrane beta-barrel protein [Planctomycetaceae bacterium]|nr:DUF6268 family outer membrane beta-barrel protein [Planctomycetaceae bacterium]